MDLIYYAVLTLAWAVGGFLSGITSMGCALIALPILNMVMSPEQAGLNSCVCAGVIAAVLVMLHHRGILFRELLLLLGASLPGSVFGVLLFECVSAAWLNMALGVVLACFVIWQTIGANTAFRLRNYGAWVLPAGFLGGLVNAMTAAPGAVMGIYTTLRTWSKDNILSMQSAFFAFSALLTVMIQWNRGLYSQPVLFDIACSLPGAGLGILASIPAQKYIDQQRCRKLLLILLALSAVMLFGKGASVQFFS